MERRYTLSLTIEGVNEDEINEKLDILLDLLYDIRFGGSSSGLFKGLIVDDEGEEELFDDED